MATCLPLNWGRGTVCCCCEGGIRFDDSDRCLFSPPPADMVVRLTGPYVDFEDSKTTQESPRLRERMLGLMWTCSSPSEDRVRRVVSKSVQRKDSKTGVVQIPG